MVCMDDNGCEICKAEDPHASSLICDDCRVECNVCEEQVCKQHSQHCLVAGNKRRRRVCTLCIDAGVSALKQRKIEVKKESAARAALKQTADKCAAEK
jgi:hypothetical protein